MLRFLMRAVLTAVLALAALPAPLSAFAQVDCDPGADYMTQGEDALAEGDYETAIDAYTCAIEAEPSRHMAYIGRAKAELLGGAYRQAFDDLNDAGLLLEDKWQAVFGDQVESLSEAIDDNPDDVNAYMLRSAFYWYQGDDTFALEDYERIIELAPDNPFGYLFRGLSNLYLGNLRTVDADFERAAELAPDNAEVFEIIGSTYTDIGQFEQAIEYLDRAVELDENSPLAYSYRAEAYLNLEDYESAVADYSAAIALSPDSADFYAARAWAYDSLDDHEAAIDDASRAIELNPDVPDYYAQRGWFNVNAGNFEDAYADFRRAQELNSPDPFIYLGSGTAQLGMNEPEAAAENYLRFILAIQTDSREGDTLVAGEPLSIGMTSGLVHALQFEADAEDMLDISAVSPTREVDPLIVVLGPDGTPLTGSDDVDAANEDYNAVISGYRAPESGIYLLLVTHAGGGSEGEVVVTLGAPDEPEVSAPAGATPDDGKPSK